MASVDMAVVDVWQREVGELSNRKFAHRLAASQDLVLRLDVSKKLEKNYVTTVSFNADGNILVSGSVDKRIMLWDWETGIPKLTFESGHGDSWSGIQAKIVPYTDDRSLITCGEDGQVRHAQISECGVETRLLAKHQRNASDLAFEPGRPHLVYTCGEDGLVQHIDLRTAATTELLRCQPIAGCRVRNPVIPLYAIAIDPRNPNVFAVVGSDQYSRLYDIRRYKCSGSTDSSQPIDYFYPPHVIVNTNAIFGQTCLAFSDQSELLVSYRDNSIYLFTQDMGLGHNPVTSSCSESNGKAIPQVYKGHGKKEMVESVSFFGPKSEYVVSGSRNGRVYIWKKEGGELLRAKKEHVLGVNCIESHPHTTVLASSGADGIKIWTPNAIDKAKLPPTKIEQDQQLHDRCFFSFGGIEYGIFDEGGDGEYITCFAGGIMTSSEDEE